MDPDERKLQNQLRRLAQETPGTHEWNEAELRRRHRRRRAVAASVVLLSLGAIGWTTMFLFDIGQGVIEHPASIVSEAPIANDSPPASQVATLEKESSVLVFLKLSDASAYERASYEGVNRPAPRQDNSVVGKLRAAMNQLVKGPTPQERGQGLSSVFSPETAGLVERVGVVESGAATVSFRDFREELPGLSTTEAGTVLMLQLNHTVFQFNDVDRVEYQIDGQCAPFGEFLQSGGCVVVARSGFRSAP